MIETASETLKFVEKDKNGDDCIHEFPDEQIYLAAVADGVSQQPCDWKASEVACKQLVDHFKKLNETPISSRLRESMIHANEMVIAEKGICERMSCTLSTVCLDMVSSTIYFGNIGDSRIFRIRRNVIDQLTKDDSIPKKKVIMTNLGRRTVDASILTKSLGMDTSTLDIQIHEIKAQPKDLYVLATDGFYNARVTFSQDMLNLNNSDDLQQDFQKAFKKYSLLAGDDMTAVVFRT